jgi:hypothetical protein
LQAGGISSSQVCDFPVSEFHGLVLKKYVKDGAPHMPHLMREVTGDDCDIIIVFLPLWVDDVSGNRSKQYNKHINIYAINSNLPGKLLQQEFFVRFVSTSQHASSPEQLSAILELVKCVIHILNCSVHLHADTNSG